MFQLGEIKPFGSFLVHLYIISWVLDISSSVLIIFKDPKLWKCDQEWLPISWPALDQSLTLEKISLFFKSFPITKIEILILYLFHL